MTTADEGPSVKPPRVDAKTHAASVPGAPAGDSSVAPAATAAAADGQPAADGSSAHALVAVPTIGDHMAAHELLPALQQLLSVYQVEYWALLEELRAKHSALPTGAAGDAGSAHHPAATSSSTPTLQQLWRASTAAGEGDQPAAAQRAQQQEAGGGMASPFAAVAQPYGDKRCGFATDAGSDQQEQQQQLPVPSLQQAELLLQQLPAGQRDAGAADSQQLQEWRQRWSAVAPSVAGLEQLASAATLQYMDAQGALACLCGQQGRWLLRRSAASLGRSTEVKGDVDIDLGKAAGEAGVGGKVSRLQAQLLLTADGRWSLTNTGRAPLAVNGQQVSRGSTVALPHLSLVEVASLPLLFMVNSMAVQRAVARSVHLAM